MLKSYLVFFFFFFFKGYGDHRDLHVLTHSSPTRRSSDLSPAAAFVTGATIRVDGGAPNARRVWGPLTPSDKSQPYDGFHRAAPPAILAAKDKRSEEHTSELQSLMRISYAVFCLKKKKKNT